MKTVLLTGASGYVGSEVLARLVKAGKEVTILGRTQSTTHVHFLQCDIANEKNMSEALSGKSYDCIIHCASLPGDTGNAREMMSTNVLGYQNILEFAARSKSKRVVLASSISAYGWYPATKFQAPDYLPVDEEHPCRPKDMYSVTKRIQELLSLTYYHQFGVSTIVLRLTAVIGPRGKGGGRNWRTFAEQLATGFEVEVPQFSAKETCHYVDIRDVSEMLLVAAENSEVHGEIFNCCGPKPVLGGEFEASIKSLIANIQVKYGYPWSLAQGGQLYFDMSKAKKFLGFAPRYDVLDSLKYIISWIEAGGLREAADSNDVDSGVKKQ